ncbi:HlyD family efflux transporter periplasmic adaptor subunit [Parabacteroides sp. BX2]|jgi:HlyD family secretion protein|uniref:HlyD family efflux transporter periplasmic adaptor subunit n=2 Tax=Tannerellaceae TaxID=2005525 RepID=A0ABR7E8Y7_9BACT|nr:MULTISPECIES: HlyD family efflux transporter periplasmic adaptor subunit [Parabacteroides]MBC5646245.1 HlyD family efflux transporter periplasmic adaptor subunit [Parabacteroides segnis]MCM0716231.1 HlyD family efflux transporter periplasmic adaptor subunit [Parabacteroides sp. TA-V-105]
MKKNMKRLNSYTLIATALLSLAACNRGDGDFDATGTFEATEILVSSEANGKIMELNIEEGDRLDAGALIGYVDSTQLYLKKMQLSAGLRSVDIRKPDIRKQIAALEQQIATARTEQQRMENLVKAKAGNQKQVDDIVNNIKYLQKQLDAQYSTLNKTTGGADAEAEGILYQIMQLDDQLQKSRIVNPQAGTVLVKYAEPGEVTAAGKPLYKIADTDLLYLRAYITADQLSTLKQGQTVRVFADYGEDDRREYPGTITWISDKSEFTPKGIQTKDERANLVYAIKIAVKNDGYLKIGQYGETVFE